MFSLHRCIYVSTYHILDPSEVAAEWATAEAAVDCNVEVAEWATAEAAVDCKVEVAEWATAETTADCRVEADSGRCPAFSDYLAEGFI